MPKSSRSLICFIAWAIALIAGSIPALAKEDTVQLQAMADRVATALVALEPPPKDIYAEMVKIIHDPPLGSDPPVLMSRDNLISGIAREMRSLKRGSDGPNFSIISTEVGESSFVVNSIFQSTLRDGNKFSTRISIKYFVKAGKVQAQEASENDSERLTLQKIIDLGGG